MILIRIMLLAPRLLLSYNAQHQPTVLASRSVSPQRSFRVKLRWDSSRQRRLFNVQLPAEFVSVFNGAFDFPHAQPLTLRRTSNRGHVGWESS